MSKKRSKSCNDTLNSTQLSVFLLRHQFKLISWCVASGFFVVMALSPAIAGTDRTNSIRMQTPAGKSAPLPASPRKDDAESRVVFQGVSLAEWTQRFWNRFMSIPFNVSPATDKTGINCGINQSGPVWFLGAPLGGPYTLSCTIPAGKVILAPAITTLESYPCPEPPSFEPAPNQTLEDFLTQEVTPFTDSFSTAMELDGKPLKLRRVTAGLQSFTGAKDLAPDFDPCVTGSPQLGVADGKYAVIGPLSPGLHILHIQSNSPQSNGSNETTFNLTIQGGRKDSFVNE